MTRTILSVALACWIGLPALGQVLVSPKIKPPVPAEPSKPKVMSLHPMAAPDPLLRYRFWPAPEHRRHANCTPFIHRAVMLALQMPADAKKDFVRSYNEWSDLATDELPKEDVRALLDRHASVLAELQRGENLMEVGFNLQLDQLTPAEMIQTLLPEIQEMRHLGRLLSLRARLALAERRWDDLADDCRLGFRLADAAGRGTEFLIGRLVGFAIAGIFLGTMEEAIQHPECPNMYWALVSMPEDRLFETRESIEFESVLLSRLFKATDNIPNEPIGETAARERLREIINEATLMMMNSGDRMANAETANLLAGTYVVTLAEPSRELLAETAEWSDRASELSASEAVLRAAELKFDRLRDRWIAWSMLPAGDWEEYSKERRAALGTDSASTDVLQSLIRNLMPAVDAARIAGRRTNQNRNFLITIEAIRMHAASTGQLPETVQRLRPVPAWRDAVSTKPFGYHRSSPTRATLTRAARWVGDPETTVQIELKGTK